MKACDCGPRLTNRWTLDSGIVQRATCECHYHPHRNLAHLIDNPIPRILHSMPLCHPRITFMCSRGGQWSLQSLPNNPYSKSRIMDTPRVIVSYYLLTYYLVLYYKYNDILKKEINIKTTFYKIIQPSNQTIFPKFYPYFTRKMS